MKYIFFLIFCLSSSASYAASLPKVGICDLSTLLQSAQHRVSAKVVAREQTAISAEIAGKIIEVNIDYSGQKVKAGEILARLDDTNLLLQARLLQA